MKHAITNAMDVKKLVDTFYQKVNADPILSLVFNTEANVDWQIHLKKMYEFWGMQLIGTYGYTGNAFFPHTKLSIEKIHFEKWLELFLETVDENFIGDIAELAKHKAKNMSRVFQYKLGILS